MEIKRYLLVQWLTESRFGKTKFGFPIEIRSRLGDLKNKQSTERVYGIELGSVTLKINNQQRVAGLGRAPIPENISGRKLTRVLNSAGSVLVHLRYVTKRPLTGEGCDPGNSGFWERDYGWGVRVRRPFGARGMSSVRYGTRLGDLKNKQPTERESLMSAGIGCTHL